MFVVDPLNSLDLRRILSILLICIIAYQCVGNAWLHWIRLESWREQQWSELESGEGLHEMQSLRLSDLEAVRWENAREFEHDGLRYDLISKHRLPSGEWLLDCVLDGEESELESDFEAQCRVGDGDHHGPPQNPWLRLDGLDYLATQTLIWEHNETTRLRMHIADWELWANEFAGMIDRPPCRA